VILLLGNTLAGAAVVIDLHAAMTILSAKFFRNVFRDLFYSMRLMRTAVRSSCCFVPFENARMAS